MLAHVSIAPVARGSPAPFAEALRLPVALPGLAVVTSPPSHGQVIRHPASFEAALAELEALVGDMESGQLPLEDSLAAYKRGAALLAYCQNALADAQQQVEVLEKAVLKPFDAAPAADED